jgi:hypothetical protein
MKHYINERANTNRNNQYNNRNGGFGNKIHL